MATVQPLQPATQYCMNADPRFSQTSVSGFPGIGHVGLRNGVRPGFSRVVAGCCGGLQVVNGFIVIAVATLMIMLCSWGYWLGTGFWCGSLFLASGLMGIASHKTQSTCAIVICLILSLFAVTFSTVFVTLAAIGINRGIGWKEDAEYFTLYSCEPNMTSDKICQFVNLFTALIEFITAFIQAANAWRAICCPEPEEQITVILQQASSQIVTPSLPGITGLLPWDADSSTVSSLGSFVSDASRIAPFGRIAPSGIPHPSYDLFRQSQMRFSREDALPPIRSDLEDLAHEK